MKKKIVSGIILIILMIFTLNVTNTYASPLGDVISGGKNFISSGSSSNVTIHEDKLQDTSESVYGILLGVSFVVVAIIGITLGMKFMMAGVEEKADVKKALVTFVIGCIVVYGAFGIWRIMVTFLNNL